MMTLPVPIYVYKCANDHTFEAMQSMSEDSLEQCEVCGGPAQRILFAPAVHFKGSGFYTTDYARKGAGKGKNGSDGDGSGDSKSEKKPDSSDSSSSSKGSESKGSDSGSSGAGSPSDSKKTSSSKD